MENNTNQQAIVMAGEQQRYVLPPTAKVESPNEPNTRFVRGGRPNYFRRQEKKNGKDWIDKSYNHLDKDIPIIVMDFINGNISEADVMYLFNNKLWYKLSNVVYDKLTKLKFRVEANKVYAEHLLRTTGSVPQYFIGLRNNDENEYYVWRDFQQFLEYFSTLSKMPNNGSVQAIQYTLQSFIPNLSRYKGIML